MERILDKTRVARAFRRSHDTYDTHATVQRQMADDLVGAIARHAPDRLGHVLELGCGTGLVTRALVGTRPIAHYTVNDLVHDLATGAAKSLESPEVSGHTVLSGDIERLEAIPDTLSLIVSGATFQWLREPAQFLPRMINQLEPGGLLAFTTFGPENLAEFRDLTGVGLHYPGLETLRHYVSPGADVLVAEEWHTRLFFDHPRDVLRHLQRTGVNGAGQYRWSPRELRAFCADYERRHGRDGKVPVTYHPILVVARRR